MTGYIDNILLLLGCLLQLSVVVCSLYRREFLRYLPLNIYMLASATVGWGLFMCMDRYGVNSNQYFYAYYTSDLLLCVAMYSVVIHLYRHTLGDTSLKPYIRGGAFLLLVLTALFSYLVVRRTEGTLTARFAAELEQNLNFVGVVLTYMLWAAILKRRETRARLVQLVLSLGIYFSAIAVAYAVRGLFPQLDGHGLWRWAPPLISLWVPLAFFYAFLKVPNEARMMMSRVSISAQVPMISEQVSAQ
jgi:hypothetical protein